MAPGGVHNSECIREEFTSNIDSSTPGHIIISQNHRPQGPPHVSACRKSSQGLREQGAS